ncbi:2-hydroxyacid dehydrogenase [Mesorhizobium sp. A623]
MKTETNDSKPTVLIVGSLHPGVRSGLADHFYVVEVDKNASTMPTSERLANIRAIACAGFVNSDLMDTLPNLEIIASFGVGYDGIDVHRAAEQGIVVTYTPGVLDDDVADATIWLLLNAVRGLSKAEAWLRQGEWKPGSQYPLSAFSLKGRSVGIFGLGRIGRSIARRVEGFGLPVSYHNRRPLDDVGYHYHPSLLALAQAVDTLIAVAPGSKSTDMAVNREVLAALGPQGVFINVGRGSTVDEHALIDCLRKGTIAAAGLDVFASEPDISTDLLALDNVTVLPHVAAATVAGRADVAKLVVDNIVEWFAHGRVLTPVVADLSK